MPFKKGQSGNPKGRQPGQTDKRGKLRAMIEAQAEEIIQGALDAAKNGDTTAMRLLLERVLQPYKPTLPLIDIPELSQAGSLTDKASVILSAMGDGRIPPDIASTMLESLSAISGAVAADAHAATRAASKKIESLFS